MDQEGIKRRMNQRLQDLRLEMKEVAEATEDPYRSVQNWLREDNRVPADFVARYVTVVPVNIEWLLTGIGSPDRPDEAVGERLYSVLSRLTRSTLSADEKRELLREFDRVLASAEDRGD